MLNWSIVKKKVYFFQMFSMIDEWLRFILCMFEACFQELEYPVKTESLKGPAMEVLSYAMGTQKSPAVRFSEFSPFWPPQEAKTPEGQSMILHLIATWVWHVTLNTIPYTERTKAFFHHPENHSRLRYLAVSPAHHYRLLLGIYWPSQKSYDLHEQIQPKNLLSTEFCLEEIQTFSGQLYEQTLSSLAIRQHTYRMRIEMITLFYKLMGMEFKEIREKVPGAPQSILKASFSRLARVLGDSTYVYG